MTETIKHHELRVKAGWYTRYCHDPGIDIGCGPDPVQPTFRRWDMAYGDGDATYLHGLPAGIFATVYSSHLLEHLADPVTGLQNWYRILRPGGHLIVDVPHRDLYERRTSLPSRWNRDHKHFFLPDTAEEPCTLSFWHTVLSAIPNADIVSFEVLREGWQEVPEGIHPVGCYTIEAIIKKP